MLGSAIEQGSLTVKTMLWKVVRLASEIVIVRVTEPITTPGLDKSAISSEAPPAASVMNVAGVDVLIVTVNASLSGSDIVGKA